MRNGDGRFNPPVFKHSFYPQIEKRMQTGASENNSSESCKPLVIFISQFESQARRKRTILTITSIKDEKRNIKSTSFKVSEQVLLY